MKTTILEKCIKANEFTANAEQHLNITEKHLWKAFVHQSTLAENICNLQLLTSKVL